MNTTITCAEVGCTALAELTAFDPTIEEAENCVLNINVHPTDFDEDFIVVGKNELAFCQNLETLCASEV